MQIYNVIRNDSDKDFAERLSRAFAVLAEVIVEGLKSQYDEFPAENKASFAAFAANTTIQEEWRENIIERLECEVDTQAARDGSDKGILHVFYSGGAHTLVVNGTRGPRASYEHIATHPDGYLAITDFYAGGDGSDKVPTPAGGNVFSVVPVPYRTANTVSEEVMKIEMARTGENNGLTKSIEAFSREDDLFTCLTPLAGAESPEPAGVDKYAKSLEEFKEICGVVHGDDVVVYKEHEAGLSAWVNDLHVGEYRQDTQRGVVFA